LPKNLRPSQIDLDAIRAEMDIPELWEYLVLLKNAADSTSWQKLKLGRDWAGL
jgi:hypothetical protein